MDSPGYSPAVAPLWRIMGGAHERGVKVLLEGQGGDEVLGGYPRHVAVRLLRSGQSWAPPTRLVSGFRAFSGIASARVLALWMARELAPPLERRYRERFGALGALRPELARLAASAEPSPRAKSFSRRLVLDLTQEILPGLLHYGDAVSMAHSVEARQPFLDVRLVELAFGLPDDWRVGQGETKRILREYLREHSQSEIAARREKVGFATPVAAWLAADGGKGVRDLLLATDSRIAPYTTRTGVEQLVARAARGGNAAVSHLYRLVSTELWLRACLP
jgi:asparagine synthase (glutamine-hydrolysing)